MHNTALDKIIRFYQPIFRDRFGIDLLEIWIHTDNAPHQYRCRQTFIQIASVAERHPGISIVHNLAVVDNFKGVHDGYNKEPAHTTKDLELRNPPVRSPTAEIMFANLIPELEMSREESKWHQYEVNRDAQLKRKGKYGLSARCLWFVVETNDKFNELNAKHPGKILLCDRSFILDTKGHKAVSKTTKLHELRSKATAVPAGSPRVWPLVVSNLPCRCPQCKDDPFNTTCDFMPWRRTRTVQMEVERIGVGDIKAVSYIGDRVGREVEGVIYFGSVESYDVEKKTWTIKFDDGDTAQYEYIGLIAAKQILDGSP